VGAFQWHHHHSLHFAYRGRFLRVGHVHQRTYRLKPPQHCSQELASWERLFLAVQEHQFGHRVLAHPEHRVLPEGVGERLDRTHRPSHDQEAVLVGGAPGGIVGDDREPRLGQQEAQQDMLEPVGVLARRDAERIVGGEKLARLLPVSR
jgi:hypothetical protein